MKVPMSLLSTFEPQKHVASSLEYLISVAFGTVMLIVDEHDRAFYYLERAREIAKEDDYFEDDALLFLLANSYYVIGKKGKSYNIAIAAHEINPNVRNKILLGSIEMDNGNLDKSINLLEDAIEIMHGIEFNDVSHRELIDKYIAEAEFYRNMAYIRSLFNEHEKYIKLGSKKSIEELLFEYLSGIKESAIHGISHDKSIPHLYHGLSIYYSYYGYSDSIKLVLQDFMDARKKDQSFENRNIWSWEERAIKLELARSSDPSINDIRNMLNRYSQ